MDGWMGGWHAFDSNGASGWNDGMEEIGGIGSKRRMLQIRNAFTITPSSVEVTPFTPPSPATARQGSWLDWWIARLRKLRRGSLR